MDKSLFNEWVLLVPELSERPLRNLFRLALVNFVPVGAVTADKILEIAVEKNFDIGMMVASLEHFGANVSVLKDAIAKWNELKNKDVPAIVLGAPTPVITPEPVIVSAGPMAGAGFNLPLADGPEVTVTEEIKEETPSIKPTGFKRRIGINRGGSADEAQPSDEPKPEKKGLGKMFGWLGKKKEGSQRSSFGRSFGGNFGSVASGLTDKIKERWQIFAIGIIAILFILSITFLGPITGGQSEIKSTGSPIDTIPVMAFFTLLMMIPLFLEANDRGDIFDAISVLASVVLSSTAVIYEEKWSTLMAGTRPLGTYIIGFLFFAPFLIMTMSAVTNRTRNVFASKIFSKLDFTPVYMTLLVFWALAKTHVYWDWVPNPCFLPENFYLNTGILFLLLELSGNFVNLGIALVAGISSGYLMFNPTYFYVVFIIYMIVMGYASTDWATREMTMNVDTPPSLSPEGGTSFGKGVRSKRFVPYDLLAGALWFTAITVVVLKGNPAFPFTLPF